MSGGSQNSVKLLAGELYKNGHDVAVFSVDKISEEEFLEIDGIRLFKTLASPYDLFYMYSSKKTFSTMLKNKYFEFYNKNLEMKFKQCLEEYQPDIVHFNSVSGMPLTLMKIAKQ